MTTADVTKTVPTIAAKRRWLPRVSPIRPAHIQKAITANSPCWAIEDGRSACSYKNYRGKLHSVLHGMVSVEWSEPAKIFAFGACPRLAGLATERNPSMVAIVPIRDTRRRIVALKFEMFGIRALEVVS